MDNGSASYSAPENESTFAQGGNDNTSHSSPAKIVYDRLFLLKCRESIYAKAVPTDLPEIPGVTVSDPAQGRGKHAVGAGENPRVVNPSIPEKRANVFNYNDLFVPVGPSGVPLSVWERAAAASGPLAQYRRRQSIASRVNGDRLTLPERFYNVSPAELRSSGCRGVVSPIPMPLEPQFTPPPLIVHPIQGPAGVIPEDKQLSGQLSKLNLWRRTHSRNSLPDAQGYTTSKAPQLRSSFPPNASFFDDDSFHCRNRNQDSSPTPYTPGFCDPRTSSGDSAYDSHHSIDIIGPDDPSIIAYKSSRNHGGDLCSNTMGPMSLSF